MKRMKSDQVRLGWRDVLDAVQAGETIIVERYNRTVAFIAPARGPVRPSDTHMEKRMRLINLTPHPLTVFDQDGAVLIEQAPDGPMARCDETREEVGAVEVDGHTIPLRSVGFGAVTGLPAPQEGVLYVVSRATAEAAADRDDVVYPDEQVRSEDGRIIGCRALARVTRGPAEQALARYADELRAQENRLRAAVMKATAGEDTGDDLRQAVAEFHRLHDPYQVREFLPRDFIQLMEAARAALDYPEDGWATARLRELTRGSQA